MSISSNDTLGWVSWDDDDPSRFVDETDVLAADEVPPWVAIARLEASGEAHSAAALAIEDVTIRGRVLVADQYAGIAGMLADAAACPDPWVGPDPTLDPAWRDPRDRTVSVVRAERRDIAVRAAAADLAVRLGMSETMVRTRATHADTLRQRCPRVWESFRNGQVPELNATTAAQQAASLPSNSPDAWAAFDDGVMAAAHKLPPNKFRLRARAVRERVHPEDLETRHRRAAEDRNLWVTPEHDGMASLTVFGPAADVYAAHARADAHARHLHAQPGETRTLAQLRADVVVDLLVNGETTESGAATGRTLAAVTIPMMTMLGQGDEPAILDGYGPIDIDTARRLAGEASSVVRILTHPVTGTVLDLDRTTYKVTNSLRRWLGVRDRLCIFPGCTRLSRDCDIDHRHEWQYGGKTSAENTAPLCERHHVVKTKSLWKPYRDETTGATWWVTPTAITVGPDPAPF